MNVYYRRFTTWQKWPDNDLVDEDYISYSLSKRKWKEFFRSPICDMPTRQKLVAANLSMKVSNIKLVKP